MLLMLPTLLDFWKTIYTFINPQKKSWFVLPIISLVMIGTLIILVQWSFFTRFIYIGARNFGLEKLSASKNLLNFHKRTADFKQMWNFINDHYCYLSEKVTNWNAVGKHYQPLAASAEDKTQFIKVLTNALDELYDPHTHLTINLPESWRLPAYDIWAEWQDGKPLVIEVRSGSPAARAGVIPGMEIVAIDSKPILEMVSVRYPQFLRYADPAANQWVLLSVLSGQHNRSRELVVRQPSGTMKTLHLDDEFQESSVPEAVVSTKLLPGDVGYIRIASFETDDAVSAFDLALESQRTAHGLIIDVRNNPGGDTAVARPIMGRLISQTTQYAWMARRQGKGLGKRWSEYVKPWGPWTYTGPVVVLVNHWSASMAEGFSMGLDGMKRATVVGTRMASLGAAIAQTTLTHSGIGVQISAEPVYHVDGRPRTMFAPKVEVNLTLTDLKENGDPILTTGLEVLNQKLRMENEQTF